jgi:hypothetical protein
MTEGTSFGAEDHTNPAEEEIKATLAVYNTLKLLAGDARERVVKHVAGILEIGAALTSPDPKPDLEQVRVDEDPAANSSASPPTFKTFGELFHAADPQTASDKALVAGYWLQVCKDAETFDGQSAQKELNHLGHKLANVTVALGALNSQRPALAIQLAKSGSSKQARKTYKVTGAGIEAVRAMLNG